MVLWWQRTLKKSWYISFSVILAAGINIGLNFIFIPYLGIIGAAFATLISYFIWNTLFMYYSAKFYKLYFDLRRLSIITCIVIILYFASLFVANTNILIINIGIKIILLLCYTLILFHMNFFDIEEKKRMKKIMLSLKNKFSMTTKT